MSLILKVTNPDEWRGSMALAVTQVITDVLSDGAPFKARLLIEGHYHPFNDVDVTALTDGQVAFETDYGQLLTVPVTEILMIEVL